MFVKAIAMQTWGHFWDTVYSCVSTKYALQWKKTSVKVENQRRGSCVS